MSDNTQGFFSDPKVGLSLLALIVSIASLVWTLVNQWNQNKRWDALNLARIELQDQGFIVWKEMTEEQVKATTWGYTPTVVPVIENRVYTGRYQLLNCLVVLDMATKERTPNSSISLTVPEIDQEIVRLGLVSQPQRAAVARLYQARFDFKNMGATAATAVRTNITVESPQAGLTGDLFQSDQEVNLHPTGTMNAPITFYLPFDKSLPDIINFNIKITYKKADGQNAEQNIPVTYDAKRNFWHLGK